MTNIVNNKNIKICDKTENDLIKKIKSNGSYCKNAKLIFDD
jgi:hypothetical protein